MLLEIIISLLQNKNESLKQIIQKLQLEYNL